MKQGIILSGSHRCGQRLRVPPEIFDSGLPVLGHLLWPAGDANWAARCSWATAASSAEAFIEITTMAACCSTAAWHGANHQVWMSHGDKGDNLAFRPSRTAYGAPSAVIADDDRHIILIQFHPSGPHPDGISCSPISSAMSAVWRGGRWPSSARPRSRRSGRRWSGKVICGPFRRSRQRGGGSADPRGDRRAADTVFVDHGLMRSGRSRSRSSTCSATTTISRSSMWTRNACSTRPCRGHRSRDSRKFIGKTFIDVFEEERADQRRRFPGAGHALSGRHRSVSFWPSVTSKPPQCRRAAERMVP